MDYVFCVRSVKSGAFTDEPGATHFLEVPANAGGVSPAQKITKRDWVARISEAAKRGEINGEPTGDILFYVHGFNNSQAVMLERHRKLRAGLAAHGFDGVVVSFDWPSADSALNYLEDRKDAKQTALRLVDEGISSFAALQRPDCRINMHILAHSMGCYVVREAFDDADDRPAVAGRSWAVSQVMLVAGDVSESSLGAGNPKSSSLYRHCVRLTNYYNPLDGVLSVSGIKRVGVAPRAGRVGLPEVVPEKAVNLYCGAYYRAHKDEFDDDPISGAHRFYFDDATFMEDVYHTVEGQLDRHEIPTRVPTDQGNLALKP